MESDNFFKEKFCLSYYSKHGSWPRLEVTKLSKTNVICRCYEQGKPLDVHSQHYKRSDWILVEARKTFNVLPKYDLSDMISDKATSYSRAQLRESVKRGNIGHRSDRAVIGAWIKSQIGDPGEFLEDISVNGFGEYDVVGVCPKERELKIFTRFFGLLTLRKRMYVVLTEAMIAVHLLAYFPEITMMDDSLTLLKKMFSMTHQSPSLASAWVDIFSIIDYDKWNSNMRADETIRLFCFFDQLFGLTMVFERSLEMFSLETLYMADGTFIHSFTKDGKMCESWASWNGHLGGIEGLRQKGWTIFTVNLIRMVAEQHNVQFHLMGQGNNQVLRIRYAKSLGPEQIKRLHESFFNSLN